MVKKALTVISLALVFACGKDTLETKPAIKVKEMNGTQIPPGAILRVTLEFNDKEGDLVKNLGIYRNSFVNGFEHFYGPIGDWCIIGLLPSYLERKHSSLVYMVDEMIRISTLPESGFYLYDFAGLAEVLTILERRGQKTLLIGVTFGLLDFF